jgi:hypothetical protein
MDFEDTDIEVFGTFVNWLYTQRITDSEGNAPSYCSLTNLWLLADRVMVPRLQNRLFAELDNSRLKKATSMSPDEYQRVYDNTHEDSPLRGYIVDT